MPSRVGLARTVVMARGLDTVGSSHGNLARSRVTSVHYWASPVEAQLCSGEEVALVGAGNSAGQAAVFLSPQVKRLTMLVRGEGLEASMSRYLVDRISMLDNVDIRVHSELTELQGAPGGGLGERQRAQPRQRRDFRSPATRYSCSSVPSPTRSGWRACGAQRRGYVLTGAAAREAVPQPLRAPLQTSPRACLPSATCAPARPSASHRRSAKARRWWRDPFRYGVATTSA